MQYFAPPYYRKFKCIADRCTHSCCIGWEIDIDADELSAYRAMSGEAGELVRAAIVSDAQGAHFALQANGRCALLDERGLCRLITAAGETALCEICREHPRFYNDVGCRWECGLGVACEEAARLMLDEEDYDVIEPLDACDETECAATVSDFDAIAQRTALYEVLRDGEIAYEDRLREITVRFGVSSGGVDMQALCAELEYLYAEHRSLFEGFGETHPLSAQEAVACERFFAYLIYRHASTAESAYDFRLSVGVALVLERILRVLLCAHRLPPIEAVRILSEEIEYCEENVALIRAYLERDLT